ncbi:MAG: NAD-dependent epimerase/dehydratase family protein [Hamadaea sp.]|nr:NAD-dependent epimerase/dehydratase family protein [Hamadaea sp.]NUR52229.1 NAD-dependent epimerase/dehydratase family protein [Hamadaea sp.]NUT02007.1 NAD-dependent epimerase/dehydratase family protein [Hamadaea sp.]
MKVLVTGGAGFIGRCVAERLTASGHDVRVFDRALRAAEDVRDPVAVDRAVSDVDAVVHLAAMVGLGVDLQDLPEYAGCNDLGTAVVLAAMARHGVRRLVLASSMVVYGDGAYTCAEHGPVRAEVRRESDLSVGRFEPTCPQCGAGLTPEVIDEDAMLDPRSVYAATKLAQEHLAAAWAHASGSRCAALRYHNVYGPGMPRDTPYAGVAAIFRSSLSGGQAPQVFEDGRQRRDFVHVADIAAANEAALSWLDGSTSRPFRAFNIASGVPHTVGEMAATLSTVMDGPEPVVTGRFRAGDVRHIVASPERARRELGFTAAIPFEEGMAEFAAVRA